MKPKHFFRSIKNNFIPSSWVIWDTWFRKDPKWVFKWHGIHIYAGRQGCGKTFSAVRWVCRQMIPEYSKVILVTNTDFNWKEYCQIKYKKKPKKLINKKIQELKKRTIYFETLKEFRDLFNRTHNGRKGVIFLIDEAHIYINAQDSKDTPKDIFKNTAQLRKSSRLVIATSQVYNRLGIALKEQATSVILSNTYFNVVTTNRGYEAIEFKKSEEPTQVDVLYEDDSKIKPKKFSFFPKIFWHEKALRMLYETRQIIKAEDYVEGFDKTDTRKYKDV